MRCLHLVCNRRNRLGVDEFCRAVKLNPNISSLCSVVFGASKVKNVHLTCRICGWIQRHKLVLNKSSVVPTLFPIKGKNLKTEYSSQTIFLKFWKRIQYMSRMQKQFYDSTQFMICLATGCFFLKLSGLHHFCCKINPCRLNPWVNAVHQPCFFIQMHAEAIKCIKQGCLEHK